MSALHRRRFIAALAAMPLAARARSSEPRVLAALRLTFGAALIGALINAFFGFIVAWTLVRYRFFGSKFLDALIDLPFALPTAVSGLALTTIYSQNGVLGRYFYAWRNGKT